MRHLVDPGPRRQVQAVTSLDVVYSVSAGRHPFTPVGYRALAPGAKFCNVCVDLCVFARHVDLVDFNPELFHHFER